MIRPGLLISLVFAANVALAQEAPPQDMPATAPVDTNAGSAESEQSLAQAPAPAPAVETGREGTIKDRSVHASRPIGVSLMAYVPWIHGLGIGANARVEIPIVKDGFIPSINDQFSLEPSFSIAYRRQELWLFDEPARYLDITPAVYGMWSFHVSPKFRPYGTLGLGYNIGNWLNEDDFGGDDDIADDSFFFWDVAAGLFYNFSEHVSFRAEVGARGTKVGLSGFF